MCKFEYENEREGEYHNFDESKGSDEPNSCTQKVVEPVNQNEYNDAKSTLNEKEVRPTEYRLTLVFRPSNSGTTVSQRKHFLCTIHKAVKVIVHFPTDRECPGRTSLISHSIRTTSDKPFNLRHYRTPHSQRNELMKTLDDMLDKGYIMTFSCPYSAPILTIPKPESSFRLCVDYRKLNDVTVCDGYPIPRVEEIFEKNGKQEMY